MVGYGKEDNHFVVELTYNYGIKSYRKGNDFQVCIHGLCMLHDVSVLHDCYYLYCIPIHSESVFIQEMY